MRKRNWLEVEKQRLDADRMEREFLERERIRVEFERRREQERIHREREELRRQQEQLRFEQERRSLKRPYDMDSRYGEVFVFMGNLLTVDAAATHLDDFFFLVEKMTGR